MTMFQPRTLARGCFALYALILSFVLLQPQPDVAGASVIGLTEVLSGMPGIGTSVSGVRIEFVLNVLAFAPIPFLGYWAIPKLTWSDWIAWGFIASTSVEVFQGVFLDSRSAQFVDVVANTAGALLGSVLAVACTRFFVPAPARKTSSHGSSFEQGLERFEE